jgi:hypothetical protein
MNNENKMDAMADATRMMNYKMHAEQLNIPVASDFQVIDDGKPQTILLATGHGFIEQLTSDGFIQDGDFEKRIQEIISKNKEFMKNNNFENADNSHIFYKDYSNGVFNFKLYVQDMIIPMTGEKSVIRSIIAYFVEPKMHDFYQMCLSVGPFTMPAEELKIGKIDLQNDKVTASLDYLMKDILDNLTYKK